MDWGEWGQWRSRVGVRVSQRCNMEEMQVEKSEKKGKKNCAGEGKGSKRSHDILITCLGLKMLS